MRMWLLAGVAFTLGGCGLLPESCTAILVPSIRTTAVDAATGKKVCNARVLASGSGFSRVPLDVDFAEAPSDPCPGPGILHGGRGFIFLEAEAAGYEAAMQLVVVPSDDEEGCHPVTQDVEFRLTPKA